MLKQFLRRFPLSNVRVQGVLEPLNLAGMLACMGHHGRTRKDQITPDVFHPMQVQRLLVQAGIESVPILAAGILHDVLEANPGEDGQFLRTQIDCTLGQEVLGMVDALTDDSPADQPRAQRKARQLERIAQAPWAVQVIKLADVVASMQEGPAPTWNTSYAADYVRQRSQLVNQVLSHSSATLFESFQQALCQPVWQAARQTLA